MKRKPALAVVLVGKPSVLKDGIARILQDAEFRVATVTSAEEFAQDKVQPHQALLLFVHTDDDISGVTGQIATLRKTSPNRQIAVVADRYRVSDLLPTYRAGVNGYFAEVMSSEAFVKAVELVAMGETILPQAVLPFLVDPQERPGDRARPQGPMSVPSESVVAPTRSGDDDNPGSPEPEPPTAASASGADGVAADQAAPLAADGTPAPDLSPREQSILRWLIEGDSNKSIARKVDIAEATVKVHVKAILRKIRVHNRTQAAIWAVSHGWLAKNRAPDRAPALPPPPAATPLAPLVVSAAVPLAALPLAAESKHLDYGHMDHLMRSASRTQGGAVIRLRK